MAEGQDLAFFDLRTVHDHFDRALVEDDDVNLNAYLEAYNELYKALKESLSDVLAIQRQCLGGQLIEKVYFYRFFQLMGSVFSFVSSDLKQKIDILDELVKKDEQNYNTIKTMIKHEKDNNLLAKSDFVNGSRTLLRLHRGLDFIREFLRQLGDLGDGDKTSSSCQDAYGKTLAKHHPWVIRKAAVVAMYTMPTRELLFKKVCGENVQRNVDVLPKMLEVTADVFDRTHNLFDIHELHLLP